MDYPIRCDNPTDGNGTKTVTFPQPVCIKDIMLGVTSGTVTAAQFSNIQVLAAGKPTINISGTSLDEINKFDKLTAFGGTEFRIPLGLIGAFDPGLRDITGLNVGTPNPQTGSVINSAQISYTVAGATTPVWDLGINASDPDPNGPGIVRYLLEYQVPVSANTLTPYTFPLIFGSPNSAYLRRMFVKAPTGTVSRTMILLGGVPKYDSTVAKQQRLQTDSGVRTVGSYWNVVAEFPYDVVSGRMGDGKNIIDMPWVNMLGAASRQQSLGLWVQNTVSENLTVVVECLGSAPGA